jgi:hypothetical protein
MVHPLGARIYLTQRRKEKALGIIIPPLVAQAGKPVPPEFVKGA